MTSTNPVLEGIQKDIAHLMGGGVHVDFLSEDELRGQNTEKALVRRMDILGQSIYLRICLDEMRFSDMEQCFLDSHFHALSAALKDHFAKTGESDQPFIVTSISNAGLMRFLQQIKGIDQRVTQRIIIAFQRLSFERYEGTSATLGLVLTKGLDVSALKGPSEAPFTYHPFSEPVLIEPSSMLNPSVYRLLDGSHAWMVCNQEGLITGWLERTSRRPNSHFDDVWDDLLLDYAGSCCESALVVRSTVRGEVEMALDHFTRLVWRKGFWWLFDARSFAGLFSDELCQEDALRLIRVAYTLSMKRIGALILVVKDLSVLPSDFILGRSLVENDVSSKVLSCLEGRALNELVGQDLFTQVLGCDGVVAIDAGGRLVALSAIVNTAYSGRRNRGGGRSTAAAACSQFGTTAKVSEDGPIEVFAQGRRIARFA